MEDIVTVPQLSVAVVVDQANVVVIVEATVVNAVELFNIVVLV